MVFSPLRNSDHVSVSFSIDSPLNSTGDAPFHRSAFDYSRVDWDGLRDHLRDIPYEEIFKLGAFAAGGRFCWRVQVGFAEFCAWIQLVFGLHIHHRKYQVKPHSSPCFSTVVLLS